MLDTATGEMSEKTLRHEGEEVRAFYAALAGPVRVGIETSGQSQWFERLLAELGQEVWIGAAMRPRSAPVRTASRRRTGGMRPCCCSC